MNFNHITRSKFDHFINDPLPRDAYYLIDNFSTISCGHSLRKLSSTATKCLRVRRSSDNAETDIYFAGNYFDISGMLGWSGSDSVYVTTWYNQYDSNDLIQTSSTKQPRIVNAGTVDTDNGFPAIFFDGSNDNFEWTSNLNYNTKSIFVVITPASTITSATAGQLIFDGNDGTTRTLISFGSTTANLTNERISFLTIISSVIYGYGYTSADVSGQKILSFISNGAAVADIFMNGSYLSLSTSSSGGFTDAREPQILRYVGSSLAASSFFSGYMKEIIVDGYNSNMTGIESNMNSYYSVY